MDLIIVQRRGGYFECEHAVSAVLANPEGEVVASIGGSIVTTWRSAAKPFQLEASLSLLPEDVVAALPDEDLAIGAASHSGEPVHTARVASLMKRFGVGEGDLRCGAHWPVHEESGRALCREGREATAIHNNCSGKHTFMVAATRHNGYVADYRAPDHPLQQRVRQIVDSRTAGAVVESVIDGCGVPCFVLPLTGMATAWARVAAAFAEPTGALGRVARAMNAHPHVMSGTGRLDLALVQGARAPIVSKVGAEGIQCMAFPKERLGLALKVLSGTSDPRAVAVDAVLAKWFPGLLAQGALQSYGLIKNVVGRDVGQRVAEWR